MELQESIRDYKSREGFVPAIQRPALRPLKVFAFDPSLRRSSGNLAVVEIVNERLGPGRRANGLALRLDVVRLRFCGT